MQIYPTLIKTLALSFILTLVQNLSNIAPKLSLIQSLLLRINPKTLKMMIPKVRGHFSLIKLQILPLLAILKISNLTTAQYYSISLRNFIKSRMTILPLFVAINPLSFSSLMLRERDSALILRYEAI